VSDKSGPKSGGQAAVPLSVGGSWVPIEHNVTWVEAYLRIKRYPGASSQYTSAKKWAGAAVPLSAGTGSPPKTMWPGLMPISVQSGILVHLAMTTIDMGRMVGGCCAPFFRGGALLPCW